MKEFERNDDITLAELCKITGMPHSEADLIYFSLNLVYNYYPKLGTTAAERRANMRMLYEKFGYSIFLDLSDRAKQARQLIWDIQKAEMTKKALLDMYAHWLKTGSN